MGFDSEHSDGMISDGAKEASKKDDGNRRKRNGAENVDRKSKEKFDWIASDSLESASESESAKRRQAKRDKRVRKKTKKYDGEEKESDGEIEKEEEEEVRDVFSKNAQSSVTPETTAEQSQRTQAKKSSAFSISSEDSDTGEASASTSRKALKMQISKIAALMEVSSDSDGTDISSPYNNEPRNIKMPDCDLKRFQSAKIVLSPMNYEKLLDKHNLSEIRDQHQNVLVRRQSGGAALNNSDDDEKEDFKKFDNKMKSKRKESKESSDDEIIVKPNKRNTSNDASDDEAATVKKSSRRRAVIDSSDDDNNDKKTKQKTKRRKKADSGSDDYKPSGAKSDSDSDVDSKKRKGSGRSTRRNSDAGDSDSGEKSKPKKKGRKRIKKLVDSSDDETKDNAGSAKGRKDIRKILKVKDLDDETRLAAKEEIQRKKRIEERQKVYNVSFNLEDVGELNELVLDFDVETKEPLVSVDEKLVKKLKPHQAKGVKFMWDACFESIEKIQEEDSKGGGCILAHCMGLGKTLQVVALTHTLLSHSEQTNVERVLVICPVSTVLNWVNEYSIWLKHCKRNKDLEIFELSKCKKDFERAYTITNWKNDGGILIMGYDMFRNLTALTGKRVRKKIKDQYLAGLIDPGPDLVVCDEGHLLKNAKTALSKAVTRITTLRRIVLTGTPLQNNLNEYYCMVQFVKPNLLGKYNEYLNRFVNPITNGQYHDSSEQDIQRMKRRSHILHKLLDGCVQRRDYAVLAPFLPPKHEFVLAIRLTPIQTQLYKFYIEHRPVQEETDDGKPRSARVFQDFQNLQRIWTHPLALRLNSDRFEEAEQKRRDAMSDDEEGSLKDFIDDENDATSESSAHSTPDGSDDEDAQPIQSVLRRTRAMRANDPEPEPAQEEERAPNRSEWWMPLCAEEELNTLDHSSKLQVFFSILEECESIGDKMLVFSQSLYSLDVIEHFLSAIDENTQNPNPDAKLGGHTGSWARGLDYFRLDGSTPIEARNNDCNSFNNQNNLRARLYLISTRAGGLGINLVAANRVIIFDVSWNPSHDIQSIFRVYRFGQNKPCYIYRFLAMGTMEEKIYERQVTKLAISKRVIDEQQIDRHYKAKDLNELYQTNLDVDDERPQPACPKDRLFADQLAKFDKLIYKYHEQDSLLENKEEETLSQAEIEAAWADFEEEKKGRPVVQPNFMMRAPSGQIHGIPTEILIQLLSIIYKNGNPGATMYTIQQNIPALLNYLNDSMAKGDRSFYYNLVKIYHDMVPTAFNNPSVPHPYLINGMLTWSNEQVLNGVTVNQIQNLMQPTSSNASLVQPQQSQPTTNHVPNSNGVIEID